VEHPDCRAEIEPSRAGNELASSSRILLKAVAWQSAIDERRQREYRIIVMVVYLTVTVEKINRDRGIDHRRGY